MRTAAIACLALVAGCAAPAPAPPDPSRAGPESEAGAWEALHSGDFAPAERAFQMLESSGLADATASRGSCLVYLSRHEEAEAVLARALETIHAPDIAFNLSIARFHLRKWEDAWRACDLCLKWAVKGSRLQERAAEIGEAIAWRLDRKAELEAYGEIAKWAPGTEAGERAAKKAK